jgi:hypothetical protein
MAKTSKKQLRAKLDDAQTAASDAAGELVIERSKARTLEDENGGLKVALSVAASELKAAATPPAPAAPVAPSPPPATPRLDDYERAQKAGASSLELAGHLQRHGDELRREADARAAHAKLQTSAGPGAAPPAAPLAAPVQRAADGTFTGKTPHLDQLEQLTKSGASQLERAGYMTRHQTELQAELAAARGPQ